MIGENRTVAKYCAELKIADAVPRSFAGNHAATMRPFAGKDGASARPTRSRSVNSITIADPAVAATNVTPPCRIVKTDQKKMLAA